MMMISRSKLQAGGVELSRIVYGLWRIRNHPQSDGETQLRKVLGLCLEHGVTSFDHADIYGSYQCEEIFGRVMDPRDRHRIQLISKYGIKLVSANRPQHRVKAYDSSPEHLRFSVEQSLRNLRTDYLDVLLLHRPDPLLHADELAAAVEQLIQAGKIRSFGVSNFTPSQFDLLQSRCSFPLVTNQIELSPLKSAPMFDGTLDHAMRLGYQPMIWSPLAGGRIWQEQSPKLDHLRSVLGRIAQQKQQSEEAVALAWLLLHPAGLIPVLGSIDPVRLNLQFQAEEVQLNREEWFEILGAAMGEEIP